MKQREDPGILILAMLGVVFLLKSALEFFTR